MSSPSALEEFSERAIDAAKKWGMVFALVAIAPGLALWPLLNLEHLGFVVGRSLDVDQRHEIIRYMLGSATLVAAWYVIVYWSLRRVEPGLTWSVAAHRLNRFTFATISMPFVAALMYRGIETEHEFLTLILIAIVGGFFAVLFYRATPAAVESPYRTSRRPWLPMACVVLLFLFYSGFVSYLAILDHRNLGTHVFDLGIYDNIVWRTANGDFLGCSYCKTGKHWSSHFDPILWIVSWFYRIRPEAQTLLVFQAVWVGSSLFPLYLIARRKFERPWLAVLLCTGYVFYPALHGANLFDFHSLTLVIPIVFWAIYALDCGPRWSFWPAFVLLLGAREDMSLLACFFGAYAFLIGRPRTAVVTVLVAATYLAWVKAFVMNDPGLIMTASKETTSFHYFYEEMIPHKEEGMRGLVTTFITNPVFVLKVFFKDAKIFFFLLLLLPLLFVPLFGGSKRILMVYGLIFIGLATRKYVYSQHFQYSSVLFPILFAATPEGVNQIASSRVAGALGWTYNRLRYALLGTMVVVTVLCSLKYGAFWANESFRAGWNRIARGNGEEREQRYKAVKRMAKKIPADTMVSTSSTLGPHLSNRENIVKWPTYRDADYLFVFSEKFKNKSEKRLERLVRAGKYRLIDEAHGIELYERVPEEERAKYRQTGKRLKDPAPDAGERAVDRSRDLRPEEAVEDAEYHGGVDGEEDEEESSLGEGPEPPSPPAPSVTPNEEGAEAGRNELLEDDRGRDESAGAD